MKNIITLTGMPGSGKTTIGKLLSNKINYKYLDTDELIVNKLLLSINDIFKKYGETYFRNLEEEVIEELINTFDHVIIGLGGGAFESNKNRDLLLKRTQVIYIKTTPEIIYNRIKSNKERPLLNNNMTKEKIKEIYKKRKANYETAHIIIDTDNLTKQEIIQSILKDIRNE